MRFKGSVRESVRYTRGIRESEKEKNGKDERMNLRRREERLHVCIITYAI